MHDDLRLEFVNSASTARVRDGVFDEREAVMFLEGVAPRGREVVDHQHVVTALEQAVGDVRRDEARAACDQDSVIYTGHPCRFHRDAAAKEKRQSELHRAARSTYLVRIMATRTTTMPSSRAQAGKRLRRPKHSGRYLFSHGPLLARVTRKAAQGAAASARSSEWPGP